MKYLFFCLLLLFLCYFCFSNYLNYLHKLIEEYGYNAFINEIEGNSIDLVFEENTKFHNEYTNITFFITVSRALIKFVEYTNFDLLKYSKIIFITSNFSREITVKDFCEAAKIKDTQKRKEELIKKSVSFLKKTKFNGEILWQKNEQKNFLF